MSHDVARLTQKLIQFPSKTPDGKACLEFIAAYLMQRGFECIDFSKENVTNLYARRGNTYPNICFVGHVDVVEEGSGWKHPPFEGVIENDTLYGRGACDMKGAIASFLTALEEINQKNGSLSLILTSDEEGPALFGTASVVKELIIRNERIDCAFTGEPTSSEKLGDTIKVGRRGSLSGVVRVFGKMGHVAYPDLALNPIFLLLDFLNTLSREHLDDGFENFSPSHLEVTSFETDTASFNVIPGASKARFNIRFNPHYTSKQLQNKIHTIFNQCKEKNPNYQWDLEWIAGADPFFSKHEGLSNTMKDAVSQVLHYIPSLSTSGGTSDARFIKDLCPVIELGLFSRQAHQRNECVAIKDLIDLKNIYRIFLERMLETSCRPVL
jgi:succinyl-diaminopimelate desuccinylase